MMPRINGETYFFRDLGQFDLLRLHILPELVKRRSGEKHLRLWSAGCASGEEAYSLAILVDMLLPERSGWDIHILGSDIDQTALAKARRGRYGAWSFRMSPPAMQQRYFRRMGDEWVLDERIRSMVTFRTVDLIKDSFPAGELCDMDLILCRNVFIYFDADTVATIAEKQAAALSQDGYLMTGHTEIIGLHGQNLRSRLFADGVVYQRTAPAVFTETPPPVRSVPQPVAAVRTLPPHPQSPPPPALGAEDMLNTAREYADRGEYEQAEQICRQMLAVTPLAASPHFLLAQLAQLRGDFEQAEVLLNKTLYLDTHCVAAYLEKAALCERADKLSRAQSLRRTALDIVRALPVDELIEPYETTASEMALWLAQGTSALTTSQNNSKKGSRHGFPVPVDFRP
jgi:chemotaxis protein methyltransferase CheR